MISNSLLKSAEVKLKMRQSRNNVYKDLSVQRGGVCMLEVQGAS